MDVTEAVWLDYRQQLLRFVRTRVKDPSIAEDLVHDVLVRAYDRQSELTDPSRLGAWLYQITRNIIVDYYRGTRTMDDLPEDLPAQDHDQAMGAIKALGSCMAPLLQRLPDDYQEALRLADLEGVAQTDIAERAGLSYSGMKSRVQRARVMLKTLVLQCCEVEMDRGGRISDYNRAPNNKASCGCS